MAQACLLPISASPIYILCCLCLCDRFFSFLFLAETRQLVLLAS
uniref:Uncharacterized protein n=1 Tax=Arundo donax TaxID=35708 RepID=A0A0A9FWV7_ARUDO